ncbi:MAG: hypothetical protein V2A79_03065 [Planctomycetota bacterium]
MGFATEVLPIQPDVLTRIKTDRELLVNVIEAVGRPKYRDRSRVAGSSVRCPFHDDQHPSASIHLGLGRQRTWLFTCHACGWNDLNADRGRPSGDLVAVVLVAAKRSGREMSFRDAVCWLLASRSTGHRWPSGGMPPAIEIVGAGPDPAELARARAAMPIAQARLRNSAELLKCLWETRAVDPATAARFGVGFSPGEPGGDYWCFPVLGTDGQLAAIKCHAAGDARPKSWWFPRNAKTNEPEPLYPADVQPAGPIWVTAGEFKAMALLSAGLAAIGLMSGEHVQRVPAAALQLLCGRSVALVPDHDEVGYGWALAIARQLRAAGIEIRVLDLGLRIPGSDIGDWLVQWRVRQGLSAAAVRGELLAAFDRALSAGAKPDCAPDDGNERK